MTETIVEPLGPCPLTGYPLLAVHEFTGTHAGLALADVDEAVLARVHHRDPNEELPRLRLDEIASAAEMLRSWSELLVLATAERRMLNKLQCEVDYRRCQDLLRSRHHYDTARIVAAVQVAAFEHVSAAGASRVWGAPVMFVPDVGLEHVRIGARTAVRRLAGGDEEMPRAVEMLRGAYVRHLSETNPGS